MWPLHNSYLWWTNFPGRSWSCPVEAPVPLQSVRSDGCSHFSQAYITLWDIKSCRRSIPVPKLMSVLQYVWGGVIKIKTLTISYFYPPLNLVAEASALGAQHLKHSTLSTTHSLTSLVPSFLLYTTRSSDSRTLIAAL